MRGILLFMAFPFIFGGNAKADDKEDVKKEINQVKKSTQYIYAEVTAATELEAKDLAEEILYSEINEWVAKQKKLSKSPNIVVNNKKELWTSVSLPRGNMFRSFMYVKKSDILPAENSEIIENTIVSPKAVVTKNISQKETVTIPQLVKEIATCTEYTELAMKITNLKTSGQVLDYGKYASLDCKEDYYMAVYNTNGKVVAILTKGSDRYNVKTGILDNLDNYKGCGAIGFKIKE